MNDKLINAMNAIAGISKNKSQETILAEFVTTSTELHNIANGACCTLNDNIFKIRFLLKESFKSKRSNFVINKYVIQVIAHGKKNFMRREDIAVRTKVIKTKSKSKKAIKKERPEIKLEINDDNKSIF